MDILIILYLFLNHLVSCLKLKINEEIILRTPIKTESIEAGLRELLVEGEYFGLTQLFGLKRIDVPKIYLEAIGNDEIPFLFSAFKMYSGGLMSQEDAKAIIPSKIISDHSSLADLNENEVNELPENLLASELIITYNLNEKALLAALKRGLKEKDLLMIWTAWPLETPIYYSLIWNQADIWRILLIKSFCDAQFDIKIKLIYILKLAVLDPSISVDELLMLNISLFSFHLEILRLKQESSKELYDWDFKVVENLEKGSLSVFKSIKSHGNRMDLCLFDGIEVNSAEIFHKSSKDLEGNPFYYESRIELFVSILKRIEKVPNLFADWFCNFFFSFSDILPIMSLKLLSDSWYLFLSKSPTIEAICNLLDWFTGRIYEHYRFKLAEGIPTDLIPLLYKMCRINIPKPLELIPYDLRESEYLKRLRGGSTVLFTYDLGSFWTPQQKQPIVKLLKVFELMYLGEMDLYESVDTFFIIGTTSRHIGLSRFLEIILNLFLDIKEWYFLIQKTDMEIVPSPFLPPKLIPILVQIIVRCRHLSCKCPFKISEKYLRMAMYDYSPFSIHKFVQNQIKYLINSNENILPRLTKYYRIYFEELKRIEGQSVYDYSMLRDYYNLHGRLKSLWLAAESSYNWDMLPDQLGEVEERLKESILSSIQYFGSELIRRLGPFTFGETEVYYFLFN